MFSLPYTWACGATVCLIGHFWRVDSISVLHQTTCVGWLVVPTNDLSCDLFSFVFPFLMFFSLRWFFGLAFLGRDDCHLRIYIWPHPHGVGACTSFSSWWKLYLIYFGLDLKDLFNATLILFVSAPFFGDGLTCSWCNYIIWYYFLVPKKERSLCHSWGRGPSRIWFNLVFSITLFAVLIGPFCFLELVTLPSFNSRLILSSFFY